MFFDISLLKTNIDFKDTHCIDFLYVNLKPNW